MTLEKLALELYKYIDQKIEAIKKSLMLSQGQRNVIHLQQFETNEMQQYSGYEFVRHETMRLLVRLLQKLNVGKTLGGDNKPLDQLKQVYYRNLEGDNNLPTSDFEGRTRPIGTPITVVNIVNGVYTLANMPFIGDLVGNPSNWLIFSVQSDWPEYTNTAVKILTVEYIGAYSGYTNCCQVTTKDPIPEVANGHAIAVLTWRAYGIRFRHTPVIAPDTIVSSWKRTQTGMQFMYKHSNGKYIGLVNGDNSSLSGADRRIGKIVWTNDPLNDAWNPMFSSLESNTDDIRQMNIYPSGIANYTLLRVEKMDGRDGMYIGAIGLWNSSNVVTKIGLLIFNEDWTYKQIIEPSIDPDVYAIGMNTLGFGLTYTKYKGKHLLTVQDGTPITGKRIVLSSNNLEGPYTLHSTVFDFTTDTWLTDLGSMFRTSIANLSLFVYNNELYIISSGQPGGSLQEAHDKNTGMSTKHCAYLWKYDDAKNTWNVAVNPMLVGLHAKVGQYSDIPDTTWGNLHIGGTFPQFIEDGKMWVSGSCKGYGPVYEGSTARYKAGLIQIDLAEALS